MYDQINVDNNVEKGNKSKLQKCIIIMISAKMKMLTEESYILVHVLPIYKINYEITIFSGIDQNDFFPLFRFSMLAIMCH